MMSGDVLGTTIEAVYHTGIVVHGREFWFGQGLQCAPESETRRQFGAPLRVETLGTTEVDEEMFQDFLREASPRYTAETYNLLRHNCNNFSNEAATFLVGRGIDEKILNLPNVFLSTELGRALAPMLGMFEERMRNTQGGSALSTDGTTTSCVVEDAVPEPEKTKIAGLPELKPRKKLTTTPGGSASASSEDLAKMVRSLSQTFADHHERGADTQTATRAALDSALGELVSDSARNE